MAKGTICYVESGVYQQREVSDLKSEVDRLLLAGLRIIWVEVNRKLKPFHPLTPVRVVRKQVDALCSQGVLL